jgi:hypothetical protein
VGGAPARGSRRTRILRGLPWLHDQSYHRSGYHVTVVEADQEPRWRHVIAPHADHYLFAEDR